MNILSAEKIGKSFGHKVLFEDLSFGLAQGQKVALIGVNGCGKSTLLKILAGEESPDQGQVTSRNDVRIAFLAQEPYLPPERTVYEVVFRSEVPAIRLIETYERLTHTDPSSPRLAEVINEIEALGAWNYEVKIKEILSKLDVDYPDRLIGELSGGQRKRVALAQALIEEPDLIIMDEPTNHLDVESIEWLEKFLSTSKQSLLLVTHDRYFLDRITNEIFELDEGKLYRYKGNYAYFLAKKDERAQQQTTETERARNLFRRELDWLRRAPKARGSKAKYRIDAAEELGEAAQQRHDSAEVTLQVKGRRIGGKVLEIKHLRKAYGDLTIVDNFSYTFARRDRIGIAGPNGAGKTTLLRMIVGEEEPDGGKLRTGETIVYGYYRQSGFRFKDNQRVIEAVTEAAETVEMSKSQTLSAAQLLEHFLFPRSMHYNLVETLSGGERRRLHLLRILMTNPNFLILDEPTNDLDLVTLRRLEEFLFDFEGCLLVVSHDRFFMDRLVDHMFVFEGEGRIKDFPGNYTQFRAWAAEQTPDPVAPAPKRLTSAAPVPDARPRSRKLGYKEQREYAQLEAEIPALEARKAQLAAALATGGSDYEAVAQLAQELEALQAELDAKSDRWLELAEIAEGT